MVKFIEFPLIRDPRGSLTFLQYPEHIPFPIKSVYWKYANSDEQQCADHVFTKQKEIIITIRGRLDVVDVNSDGKEERYTLSRPSLGLMIFPKTQLRMENQSSDVVSLHIFDSINDEIDYIGRYIRRVDQRCTVVKPTKVDDCRLIDLHEVDTRQGFITAINENIEVPFELKRLYYLYEVPEQERRGAHGHKELFQLLIAASGSFSVVLDDGQKSIAYHLDRPNQGLLIVPGIWRDLGNFSPDSTCLVLASHVYSETDYIRDYNQFLQYKFFCMNEFKIRL